ncbi:MAG: DHA2 family efflux MFS transporter permease subunit [Ignavibacteriaceae bacterium]|nr:DHA2 family efflux MFS transporter permease subunit [Ignavibacteriaceae bacterium]
MAKEVRNKLIGNIPSLHHEHSSYKWWVLANIMVGTFMAVLDATVVNVALNKMMTSFGTSVDKIEWVLTAYLLVFAVMLPTSGWVADHFGYKRTYFFALFLFTLGSFLCSLSWSEDALIGFRLVQGAGAGFLMPVGMAIITREFPPEKRGIALGFWGIAAAASVSLGPMVGGYLVDNFSWQSIFDVNVPVGIVAMAATYLIQREYKTEKARSFDFVGFISMSVFLTFLLLALSNGNSSWNTNGWSSDFILTCFGLSIIGLVVFLATDLSIKHPLIELSLLKDFNFSVTNGILFIFGMGLFGSTFLLPLFLQSSLNYTALQSGLVFFPVGVLQAIMSPISGIMSDKINPKVPAFLGVVLLAIGLFLQSNLSLFSEHAQIMGALYVRGLGMGMLFTPLSTIALMKIPRVKMAQASGLFNVIRQIGGSFGVAIFGTMLTRRMLYHTAVNGEVVNQYSAAYRNIQYQMQNFVQQTTGGNGSAVTAKAKALIGQHITGQAFVQAINDDFYLAGAITLLCLLPILLLRTKKKKNVEHVAIME